MKRRHFLKIGSVSVPAVFAGKRAFKQTDESYHYSRPQRLNDVITQDGHILVRLKFSSDGEHHRSWQSGHIQVENADLIEVTRHNFETVEDVFDPTDQSFRLHSHKKNPDIFMLRLRNADVQTLIRINNATQNIVFQLIDILPTGYVQFKIDHAKLDVNFLLDKEIGEIDLSQIGVQENPNEFSFHIFADPQGGDPMHPRNHRTRMKIHNAFIQDSIILANHMPDRPLFSLILGDIVDSIGQKENFATMHQFFQNLDSPILYELGNHESKYSATFEPGYKMDAFHNYFTAQKKINGMEKILYSFNVGKWHFVVWPDPLRSFFWDNHPHYFEWLKADLEKYKDRPTMLFQHVPVHPVGISPFQGYLEPASIRKKFADIVTRHGNVKYVLSGHIHIPVKSSLKIACSIRGTNFITLPAAGYRPRGFGEQDYFGGPTQGIGIVKVSGEKARVTFKTVMEEEWTYPETCPELDLKRYKLWFNNKWDVKAEHAIQNGDFSRGLANWFPEYVYKEEENPSVRCEVRKSDGRNALYLYNRIRGYQAPGQDRLPQTINRISQVVQHVNGTVPVLHFTYKLDKANCDPNGFCGGYLWIEGYEKSYRQFNLVYSAGVAYANPVAKWTERIHDVHHFHLPNSYDWKNAIINIQRDFDSAEKDRRFNDLNVDRIVLTVGVWTLNEGTAQPFAVFFTDFKMTEETEPSAPGSAVVGAAIQPKNRADIWWRGKHIPFIHLAGEHRYHLETAEKTLFTEEHQRFE